MHAGSGKSLLGWWLVSLSSAACVWVYRRKQQLSLDMVPLESQQWPTLGQHIIHIVCEAFFPGPHAVYTVKWVHAVYAYPFCFSSISLGVFLPCACMRVCACVRAHMQLIKELLRDVSHPVTSSSQESFTYLGLWLNSTPLSEREQDYNADTDRADPWLSRHPPSPPKLIHT